MVVSDLPATERLRSLGDRFVSPVLVGREKEISSVLAAVADPPRIILITGDAGMGKTRLCESLLDDPALRGHRVLQGRCHQLREPFPFGPLIEALREAARFVQKGKLGPVAGALTPMIPELADRLPPPLEPLGDPPSERHRLFRGFADVLASLGAATLVIEDLHWADEGTSEFLMFLSRQMPPQLTVLATLREDELPRTGPLRRLMQQRAMSPLIDLGPLSPNEVRAMVAAILDTSISEEFASLLHERSGGIPFVVEELLRLLQEREDLVQQSDRWIRREMQNIEVPAGVSEPVLERLRRLSPGAQRIVEAASVAGQHATERFLLVVALDEPGPEDVTEALASGVVVERDGLVGFRHALAMQAVEEAIARSLRAELHLRAGREVERSDPNAFARLVRHFREAEGWVEFVRYSDAAADTARDHGDHTSATHFLAQALRTRPIALEERVRMSLKLGKSALHGLEHQQAIAVLEETIDDDLIQPADRGKLRMVLATLQFRAGDVRGFDQAPLAVEELRDDPEGLVGAMRAMAWPFSPQRTLEEHLAWIERASVLVRDIPDPVLRMAVSGDEGFLLLCSGDRRGFGAASRIPVDLSSREAQSEYIRTRTNLAWALSTLGHYEEALRFAREGIDISRRCEYELWLPTLEIADCMVRFSIGSWGELEHRLEELLDRTSDLPYYAVDVQLVLGQLLLARGRISPAERLLTDVSEHSRHIAEVAAYATAQGALARLELSRGDAGRAGDLVRPVLATIRRKGIWVWVAPVLQAAVEAYLRTDRRDEAELVMTEVRAGIRDRDAPAADAALSASLGLLAEAGGDVLEALRHARRSLEAYTALPNPLEANHQRARIGRLLLTIDDQSGRDFLEQAIRAFDRLGATWDAAQVRRTLRQMGVTLPYRGGRRGYGAKLSPRELEVARLAVDLSNKQVAERLFLSVKTVEKHLGSAMRKVQATCRAELAEHLETIEP